MGFDTAFIVETPIDVDYLVCQICHDVMEKPVTVCQQGHNFCKKCITDWCSSRSVGDRNCPNCRQPVCKNLILNRPLESIILSKKVQCPIEYVCSKTSSFKDAYCNWERNLSKYLETHFSLLKMKMDRCGFSSKWSKFVKDCDGELKKLKQEVDVCHDQLLLKWNRLMEKHQITKKWTKVSVTWPCPKGFNKKAEKREMRFAQEVILKNAGDAKVTLGLGMINKHDDVPYFYIGFNDVENLCVTNVKVHLKGKVGKKLKVAGFTNVRHRKSYYLPLQLRETSEDCSFTDFQQMFKATEIKLTFKMKGVPVVSAESD